ncbi:MAG: carboxypeptidase-like regulatory domain-containing protein [Proteobacteria bacterium]|nr:carboxypeptidase-like regulatory domain-containing protein [Pseudomonadota bacterium]MBU1638856.1 carboxypeptidase-like regulatory domain-containing protein [Pseudomonadota bacterium]
MIFRKKKIITLVVLIVAVFLGWFLFNIPFKFEKLSDRQQVSSQSPQADKQEPIAKQSLGKHESGRDKAESSQGNKLTAEDLAKLSPRQSKMYRGVLGTVHEIEFTGKVVDQYNDPVSGVTILYIGSTTYFGGGSGYNKTHTDENGIFKISDKEGSSLDFQEMEKKGYEIVLYGQGRLFYSFKKYPHSLVWSDYTAENPYIFKAWKISGEFDTSVELKKGSFGGVIMADGTRYGIDFLAPGRRKVKSGSDINKGQVIVQQIWEGGNATVPENRWRFIITAVDGGIKKVDSLYTGEAPNGGYQASIEFTQDDIDPQVNEGKLNTFFTYNNGRTYGRATWEISNVFKPGKSSFQVGFAINPSGERYLSTFESWVSQ